MDYKKEFIDYLIKGKVIKKSALKNAQAIEVLGNIIKNPIEYIHEGGSFQVILAEYEEWYDMYAPTNKYTTDEQLMRKRLNNEISEEEYEYAIAYLAYIRAAITSK